MLASFMENVECVSLLLERGADPELMNESGMTAMMLAVQGRNPDLVKVLLKAFADPGIRNAAKVSAISIAIDTRQEKLIALMEKAGYAKAVTSARRELQAARKQGPGKQSKTAKSKAK